MSNSRLQAGRDLTTNEPASLKLVLVAYSFDSFDSLPYAIMVATFYNALSGQPLKFDIGTNLLKTFMPVN
jgi:hypothetical protein